MSIAQVTGRGRFVSPGHGFNSLLCPLASCSKQTNS